MLILKRDDKKKRELTDKYMTQQRKAFTFYVITQ